MPEPRSTGRCTPADVPVPMSPREHLVDSTRAGALLLPASLGRVLDSPAATRASTVLAGCLAALAVGIGLANVLAQEEPSRHVGNAERGADLAWSGAADLLTAGLLPDGRAYGPASGTRRPVARLRRMLVD